MSDDEPPLLIAEGLTKSFGRQIACRDISFSLHEGEVMAVVGMTAYRHSRSSSGTQASLADRLQMQDLENRQLEGAARSYSPTCNVARPDAMANFAYCHP